MELRLTGFVEVIYECKEVLRLSSGKRDKGEGFYSWGSYSNAQKDEFTTYIYIVLGTGRSKSAS